MDAINPNTTHLLIRHQEIALKGKNRPEFEKRLKNNLSRCIGADNPLLGDIQTMSGRFVIELKTGGRDALESQQTQSQLRQIIDRLSAMGGVSAITPCAVLTPEIEAITTGALEWAKSDLTRNEGAKTFAVRTRRVDKRFPLSSAQVDTTVGSRVGKLRPGMTVNLSQPDLKLTIEVRQKHALVYTWEKSGVRGLPMDSTQRVVCLLSGGIDSPVAAYEAMRRGCTPIFAHFHSKPFTSEASISKVRRLAEVLRRVSPFPLELWLIPLLDIQKAVRDACNERHRTIHYRRFMMMIAQELAARRGAKALVTGEALGQVASQTLTNMQAIEDVVSLPVLRPLVTSDKDQIVLKAQQLGTYEISIEPHDDTCILFAPAKPATQAKLQSLRVEEEALPQYQLVFAALDAAEKVLV